MIRIGQGFDVHEVEAGDGMTLGGLWVPCDYRLVAHSDGDIVLHAAMDAMLGALALGDIGLLFPDTDPRFKGADSASLPVKFVNCVYRKDIPYRISISRSCVKSRRSGRFVRQCVSVSLMFSETPLDRVSVKGLHNRKTWIRRSW